MTTAVKGGEYLDLNQCEYAAPQQASALALPSLVCNAQVLLRERHMP